MSHDSKIRLLRIRWRELNGNIQMCPFLFTIIVIIIIIIIIYLFVDTFECFWVPMSSLERFSNWISQEMFYDIERKWFWAKKYDWRVDDDDDDYGNMEPLFYLDLECGRWLLS